MAHRIHRATPNPGPFARSIAKTLQEARIRRGITQTETVRRLSSERLTLHRSTLSRIERATADLPMSEYFALCVIYRVDPFEVTERTHEAKENA
ncbi:helix-turn-helix transcriptional regulator [Microbacterium sp. NPDC086615]|uniref:helix-turn-helix domain-containing protein n=1 Tax=Microbacterium sp. NPDC086615 TaxID=3154865 RepID=UPI00343EA011